MNTVESKDVIVEVSAKRLAANQKEFSTLNDNNRAPCIPVINVTVERIYESNTSASIPMP